MKHEWKKHEKDLYGTGTKPQYLKIPEMGFLMIDGVGNPNDPAFGDYVEALYAVSYAIRMSYKTDDCPKDYFEYTVYPLEGYWSLTEKGIAEYASQGLNKDEFQFTLMIRQPDFVDEAFVSRMIDKVLAKKKIEKVKDLYFRRQEEGDCVQICHIGSYDTEPESFEKMHLFCDDNHLTRPFKTHREIYLSDPRKVSPEKLKTLLRIQVQKV